MNLMKPAQRWDLPVENAKTLITEYKDWIAEDCLKTIKYVKPSLAKNIQALKLKNNKWSIEIFRNQNKYNPINCFSDQIKRIRWEEGMPDYMTVMRMNTCRPWLTTKVGWPVFDDYEISQIDRITLGLLELGLHESLEWISVTECGIPEDCDNIHDELKSFPLWPHDDHDNFYMKGMGKFWGEAKMNGKWHKLTISF